MANVLTSLDHSPMHQLHRVAQCVTLLFEQQMSASAENLTLRQLTVLLAIEMTDGPSQVELTDLTSIDRSTLTAIMRRLLKKGWVRRARRDQDVRTYRSWLTSRGQQIVDAARPRLEALELALLDALKQDDRERFVRSLRNTVRTLSKAPGPEAVKTRMS